MCWGLARAGALSRFPWLVRVFALLGAGSVPLGGAAVGVVAEPEHPVCGGGRGNGACPEGGLAQHRSPEPLGMVAVGAYGPCHLLGRGRGLQDKHKDLQVMVLTEVQERCSQCGAVVADVNGACPVGQVWVAPRERVQPGTSGGIARHRWAAAARAQCKIHPVVMPSCLIQPQMLDLAIFS